MYGYLIRRSLTSILVLFGVSVLVFSIIHLVPGDAVTAILGRQKVSAERVAELREQLARLGLRWKGSELRGLDAFRHATRWGQLALKRGVPCPRIMPLVGLEDVQFPLPRRPVSPP